MSEHLNRFGISEFTTWPWSFERDVERYAAHGVDTIEVCEFKLNRDDYRPQLRSVGRAGLAVSSVQSTVHSLFPDSLAPSPSDPDDRIRHMKSAIERIAPHVPAQTPFVVITGAAPGGNIRMVYDKAVTAFADLAAFAAERSVRMAYEPLNPVLLNTDTALWGLDQALELVRRVDHPALGICLDTWNIFQTPNLPEVIQACGERIFLVQVSDWHLPRSGADRISLGDGTIANAAIMRAAREAGYNGPFVLEIFSNESLPDSIWCADLDDVIDRNVAAFVRLWDESMI
ncbi:MAG: sugar phosphate isomerase/epimerase family protein [Candidatus Aquilonibacter sp.]